MNIKITFGEAPIDQHSHPLCAEKVIAVVKRKNNIIINLVIGKNRRWFQVISGREKESSCFTISKDGSSIHAVRNSFNSYDNFCCFLVHPVLGFALRLRGIVCLHATTMVVNGHAISIVGAKGSGKSTTAASLFLQGCEILADDIAALSQSQGCFFVAPGLTQLRLLPQTVKALHLELSTLKSIWPQPLPLMTQKVYLGAKQENKTKLPLAAIYILGPREKQLKQPRIEQLSATQGLFYLTKNTIRREILDEEGRVHEFQVLSELAQQVPIKQVQRPNDTQKIHEIATTILHDATNTIKEQ